MYSTAFIRHRSFDEYSVRVFELIVGHQTREMKRKTNRRGVLLSRHAPWNPNVHLFIIMWRIFMQIPFRYLYMKISIKQIVALTTIQIQWSSQCSTLCGKPDFEKQSTITNYFIKSKRRSQSERWRHLAAHGANYGRRKI